MIYKTLANRLRIRINSDNFSIGDALPSEKKLATEFSVSRMTIRKAVELLIEWGLVKRVHGSGTYIVQRDIQHGTYGLKGFSELMKELGRSMTSKVIEFQLMVVPPAIASLLHMRTGERIYYSRRVRFVDGKPLLLEDSYMPSRLFGNLSVLHLEGSKFSYIEDDCKINIEGHYESFTPVIADSSIANLLQVAEGCALLRLTSLSYSDTGEYIDYSVMIRNANEYREEYHFKRSRNNNHKNFKEL
ncbi:GntR family transcriptional regulator [Klebsiella sp. BIGb0407]|uniref:GntR family transcriptional regulator n=1 Tax=Klebsiella sp. BIGb0407 TaxID=2940603 RepID=UPI002167BA3D|nr:GntR family transcriptional regulator [Klebsiella sp. BIGb0407]MCS3431234.1 GntR family glv operon transcriptional regulator [Klebsiella sp. BIGb0407]